MAKRKIDCGDVIVDYLKERKYEKTLQLFEEENKSFTGRKLKTQDLCQKFIKYLQRQESEKDDENDDLGFEINFGAYQSATKV